MQYAHAHTHVHTHCCMEFQWWFLRMGIFQAAKGSRYLPENRLFKAEQYHQLKHFSILLMGADQKVTSSWQNENNPLAFPLEEEWAYEGDGILTEQTRSSQLSALLGTHRPQIPPWMQSQPGGRPGSFHHHWGRLWAVGNCLTSGEDGGPSPSIRLGALETLSLPEIKWAAGWKQGLVWATVTCLINDPAGRSWKSWAGGD